MQEAYQHLGKAKTTLSAALDVDVTYCYFQLAIFCVQSNAVSKFED